jgi:hypothetical protein
VATVHSARVGGAGDRAAQGAGNLNLDIRPSAIESVHFEGCTDRDENEIQVLQQSITSTLATRHPALNCLETRILECPGCKNGVLARLLPEHLSDRIHSSCMRVVRSISGLHEAILREAETWSRVYNRNRVRILANERHALTESSRATAASGEINADPRDSAGSFRRLSKRSRRNPGRP